MKRRKKVWVVLGPHGGFMGAHNIKDDAMQEADCQGYCGHSLRVVPATLEYDIPAREKKP